MMETNWGSLQRIMEIAELRSKGIQDTHFLDWTFQIAERPSMLALLAKMKVLAASLPKKVHEKKQEREL